MQRLISFFAGIFMPRPRNRDRGSSITRPLEISSAVNKGFGAKAMIATNNGHQQVDIQKPDTQQVDTHQPEIPQVDAHQRRLPDTQQLDTQQPDTQQLDIRQLHTQQLDTQQPGTEEVRQANKQSAGNTLLMQTADTDTENIDIFLATKKQNGQLTTLHLVDGEKGGVGKSLFCRVLLEYAQHKKFADKIEFVESDITNPDVGKVYFPGSGYRTAEFSLEERKRQSADHVFELAMKQSVIVNLPSNISMSVNDWMKRNQVVSLGEEFYGVRVCKWFVCTGNHSSIEKFRESLAQFGKKITHVLVKNQMIHDDWPIDDELAALIKENGVVQMNFPRFDMAERNKVDALQLTFGKALSDPKFTALGKQRIRNFLVGCYEELDKLELLP